MGWHLSIYGTNINLQKESSVEYKNLRELIRGLDGGISAPRSIFYGAMFSENNVVPQIEIQQNKKDWETWCGYTENKHNMLNNFIKWTISKTNPFRNNKYFEINVKNFIKLINTNIKGYQFYFYNDSVIFEDAYNESTNKTDFHKVTKFLHSSAKFYDSVRQGRNPSLYDIKSALFGTYWGIENNKIILDDDLQNEIDNSVNNEYEWIFYGDL